MQETGGEFVLDETYEAIGGNDFRTTVLKLKQAKADAVFVDMMDTDLVNFVRRAKEQGLNVKIMSHAIIDDALTNPEIDHSLLNDIVYFDWDTPPSKEFTIKFNAVYGKNPARSADGAYDSVIMLAEALSNVKDKAQVNTYLENNVFETISGELRFKDHVLSTRTVFIKKVVDGKAEIIGERKIIT
jgi:ABC-type branched-subunit amino acid transport system substrate-binding protein